MFRLGRLYYTSKEFALLASIFEKMSFTRNKITKQLAVFLIISSSPSRKNIAQIFKPLVLAESPHFHGLWYSYLDGGDWASSLPQDEVESVFRGGKQALQTFLTHFLTSPSLHLAADVLCRHSCTPDRQISFSVQSPFPDFLLLPSSYILFTIRFNFILHSTVHYYLHHCSIHLASILF
jgi:hypothetical protein